MSKSNLYIHRRYAADSFGKPLEEVQYWAASGEGIEQFTNPEDNRLSLNHPIQAFNEVPMGIRYVENSLVPNEALEKSLQDYNDLPIKEGLKLFTASQYKDYLATLPKDAATGDLLFIRNEKGMVISDKEYQSLVKAENETANQEALTTLTAKKTQYDDLISEGVNAKVAAVVADYDPSTEVKTKG